MLKYARGRSIWICARYPTNYVHSSCTRLPEAVRAHHGRARARFIPLVRRPNRYDRPRAPVQRFTGSFARLPRRTRAPMALRYEMTSERNVSKHYAYTHVDTAVEGATRVLFFSSENLKKNEKKKKKKIISLNANDRTRVKINRDARFSTCFPPR